MCGEPITILEAIGLVGLGALTGCFLAVGFVWLVSPGSAYDELSGMDDAMAADTRDLRLHPLPGAVPAPTGGAQ